MPIKLPQALPSLDGTAGRIVRAAYLLLAVLTAGVIATSLLFNGLDYFRNMPNAAGFGFMTKTNADVRVVVGAVTPHAEARGLRLNDLVVAVEGRVLRENATEYEVGAVLGRAGDRIALVVERDGIRHRVALDRQPSRWSFTVPWVNMPLGAYAVFAFVTKMVFPLFLFAASLLLFIRRSRDPEALLFAFGFLLICARPDLTWWMYPFLGIDGGTLLMIMHYGWLACAIAVTGFPDGRFVTRWSRVAFVLILAGLVSPFVWKGSDSPVMEAILFTLMHLAIVAVVLRWRATADQTTRQQIKWAVTGFCATAIAMLTLSSPGWAAISTLGMPGAYLVTETTALIAYTAFPLGLLVSLMRYRLYDAETALSRSAVFAVLALGLVGVFAASQKVIEALGEQYFGGSVGALAGGIAAGIAAVVIVPMHGRVERWADRRFRGNLLKLRRELPALVADLRETADARAVGDAVIARVMLGVRAGRAVVLGDDNVVASHGVSPEAVEAWRARWRPADGEGPGAEPSDPLLPVRVPLEADGCGRVGWLLLGPRPDGSLYGKDERETLADIADPVARALHIVRRRAAREAEIDARLARLEAALPSSPAP